MNKDLKDLFGNVPNIEPLNTKTKLGKFRQQNGYKFGYHCKDCKYLIKGRFYKCQQVGETSGKATDIRLGMIACKLYEVREVQDDK